MAIDPFFGSVVSGGSSLLSTGIGMIGQVKRAKKIAQFENDLSVANMKLQNEMNRDNWLEQQEYNSPARQVQRLREAGLNPNLMNGSPSNVATSPQESGDFYAPQVDNPDVTGAFQEMGRQISGVMSNYMQYKAIEQNIQESKGREMEHHANTTLLQDQLLTNAQNRLVQINEELRKQDLHPVQRSYLESQRDKVDQEISNLRQTFSHNIEYLQLHKNKDIREERELNQYLKSEDTLNKLRQVEIRLKAWHADYVQKHDANPPSEGRIFQEAKSILNTVFGFGNENGFFKRGLFPELSRIVRSIGK